MPSSVNAPRRLPIWLRLGALLLTGIAAGFLLLMLAYALPGEPICQNLARSLSVFDGSEGTPEAMDETLARGYPSTWLDNSTDVRFMTHAAYTSKEPLYRQVLLVPGYDLRETTPYQSLVAYVTEGAEGLGVFTYARYWHGYLTVLKPLLLICTYQDIRMLNMLVQGALVLVLLYFMEKRGLRRYIPALGGALLCLTPVVLALCMQYAVIFTVTLVACCLLLARPGSLFGNTRGAAFFLLTGMAASYFDLLTYPLLSFGLPCALALLWAERRGEGGLLAMTVRLGAAWLAGYAGMWAGKWALLALACPPEELQTVLGTIQTRISTEGVTRLSAIARNVAVLWRKPYKLAAFGVLAAFLALWLRGRGRRESTPPRLAASLLLLAALPFLWYGALPNHSHIHYFYTHRSLAVSVFALLALLTRLTGVAAAGEDGHGVQKVPAGR